MPGLDLSHANSLGINLDALPPPADPAPAPDGDVIAEFEIPHRPVPWSVPFVCRNGGAIKCRRLATWQATVASHARKAMAGRPPYTGPVGIVFVFTLSDCPNRSFGDTTNLQKGAEDPLQGIVFVNDKLVADIRSTRVVGGRDGASVRVFKLKETA